MSDQEDSRKEIQALKEEIWKLESSLQSLTSNLNDLRDSLLPITLEQFSNANPLVNAVCITIGCLRQIDDNTKKVPAILRMPNPGNRDSVFDMSCNFAITLSDDQCYERAIANILNSYTDFYQLATKTNSIRIVCTEGGNRDHNTLNNLYAKIINYHCESPGPLQRMLIDLSNRINFTFTWQYSEYNIDCWNVNTSM